MALNILQWNMNGYMNNYNELLILIKQYNPRLISLQETHLHSISNIPIPINYNLYAVNTSSTRYGGVAILAHKSLQQRQIQVNDDFDTICIEIVSKIRFNFYSSYIPPNINFSITNLEHVFNCNTSALITGDFNSAHEIWGSRSNSRRGTILSDYITSSDFVLMNDRSPTHLNTHGTFSHIDLSFCSPNLALQADWKTETNLCGSDHFPIIISLFSPVIAQRMFGKPRFNTRRANWHKYQTSCTELSPRLPISSNINKETAQICRIIIQSANASIPHPQNKVRKVPWWNSELDKLKSDKNKMWHVFKRNMIQVNLLNYKRANALYKRKIKLARKISINSFTSTINPRTPIDKLWSNIRNFTGYKSTRDIHCISTMHDPDKRLIDKLLMANEFCKFWSENSSDLGFSTNFKSRKRDMFINTPLVETCPAALKIEENINFIEFNCTLNSLKGKTPGMDRISYKMLQMLPHCLKMRVLELFNTILSGYIPQQFKNSIIVPIPKTGMDRTKVTSYRPISLNSCLSKVLDKIIAKRLWWFVSTNKLVSSHQFGFRTGSSTIDSLLYVDYQIAKTLSSRKHATIISLDFERAFDKIGVHSIVEQLREWKVGPRIIGYIINFMTNRKIIVRIQNRYSSSLPLSNGIPQGSPLSVILFIIAYNKLSLIISRHKEIDFCAYADDFNLIIRSGREKNVLINLDRLFCEINMWGDSSGATLSRTKCKYIHICRLRNCTCVVQSSTVNLARVGKLRILGLTINERYRWGDHIDHIVNSLTQRLNIIKCLSSTRFNCNTKTLLSISKAIILSRINYGLPFFGHAPKYRLRKIDCITNAAIRTSLGALRSTPINNMLFEANIRPANLQRDLLTTKLFRILLYSSNDSLLKIIRKVRVCKRTPKIPSVILRAINNCRKLGIPLNTPPFRHSLKQFPPWKFQTRSVDTSLHRFNIADTSPSEFRNMFAARRDLMSDYEFVYTDGSRTDGITTFGITTENRIIKMSILPPFSSVYSAELIAIHEALLSIKDKLGKFVVCSDSLSALQSVLNLSNSDVYTVNIREILIRKFPNIILMWVPGHKGIQGNEFADSVAKSATNHPLFLTWNFVRRDLDKLVDSLYHSLHRTYIYDHGSAWYRRINNSLISINSYMMEEQQSENRLNYIKLIRLRLGHTRVTHGTIFNPNMTRFCNCNISYPTNPSHFLRDCPKTRTSRIATLLNTNPLHLLSNPTNENTALLIKFLKNAKLYHEI